MVIAAEDAVLEHPIHQALFPGWIPARGQKSGRPLAREGGGSIACPYTVRHGPAGTCLPTCIFCCASCPRPISLHSPAPPGATPYIRQTPGPADMHLRSSSGMGGPGLCASAPETLSLLHPVRCQTVRLSDSLMERNSISTVWPFAWLFGALCNHVRFCRSVSDGGLQHWGEVRPRVTKRSPSPCSRARRTQFRAQSIMPALTPQDEARGLLHASSQLQPLGPHFAPR